MVKGCRGFLVWLITPTSRGLSIRSGLRLVVLVWRGPGPTAPSKCRGQGGPPPCRGLGAKPPERKVKIFLKASDYKRAPLVFPLLRGQK